MHVKEITSTQKAILRFLCDKALLHIAPEAYESMMVILLNEGDTGSFSIHLNSNDVISNPGPLTIASDYQYMDNDDVPVIVTLYINKSSQPVEVEIWKTDYTAVINLSTPK